MHAARKAARTVAINDARGSYLALFLLLGALGCQGIGGWSKGPSGGVSQNTTTGGSGGSSGAPATTSGTSVPKPAYSPLYATWLMIWVDHNQPWWGSSVVPTINYNGNLLQQDYTNDAVLSGTLDTVKHAGISAVVLDLTNGWGWLNDRTQRLEQLAIARDMQVAVADASSDPNQFEQHASDIWSLFAGPSAPYKSAYLTVDGKPVVVLYVVRQTFEAIAAATTPYASKFTVVWASGEDPNTDKWGWQLTPTVGTVPSSNSMFVTSSVKVSGTQWRKSLAFLDYNFSRVRQTHPRIVVVGSFDDYSERNFWAVSDTFNSADHDGSGQQMFDWSGATSPTAYSDRTAQWIAGTADAVAGGPVPDGDYRIVNSQSAQSLNDGGSTGEAGTAVVLQTTGMANSDHYWLHHLGGGVYRITQLHTGLSLAAGSPTADGNTVVQAWDSTDASQRWSIAGPGQGPYTLQNAAANLMLKATDANAVIQSAVGGDASQKWQLQLLVPFTPM